MLKLKKIAVTGGLSSGKTTVCLFLEEYGAFVASADSIVHQLLNTSTEVGKKVVALVGQDVVVNARLDREKIAEKVFQDISLLKRLEAIIHPEVQKEIERLYKKISQNRHAWTLFVVEIPLLFESNLKHDYDHVIAVIADESNCERRFMESTNLSKQTYYKRVSRQMSMQEKALLADFVIQNDGSLEQLQAQVKKIFNQLCH